MLQSVVDVVLEVTVKRHMGEEDEDTLNSSGNDETTYSQASSVNKAACTLCLCT
jgi:hypothetical protein